MAPEFIAIMAFFAVAFVVIVGYFVWVSVQDAVAKQRRDAEHARELQMAAWLAEGRANALRFQIANAVHLEHQRGHQARAELARLVADHVTQGRS